MPNCSSRTTSSSVSRSPCTPPAQDTPSPAAMTSAVSLILHLSERSPPLLTPTLSSQLLLSRLLSLPTLDRLSLSKSIETYLLLLCNVWLKSNTLSLTFLVFESLEHDVWRRSLWLLIYTVQDAPTSCYFLIALIDLGQLEMLEAVAFQFPCRTRKLECSK